MTLVSVEPNITVQFDKISKGILVIQTLPGILDRFFRNCGRGHTWLYQPCTSAKVFEGFPSPLVPQMILRRRNMNLKNIPIRGGQERLAMAASVDPRMRGSAQ